MTDKLTLSELNLQIKSSIKDSFPAALWILAEINEISINSRGHCYLELIEKDAATDSINTKARAMIWAYTFRILKPYFETTAGTSLRQGIKVLVKANVEFHELYGLSLNIKDIDPSYTMGDLARLKAETINKLKEDGVFEMNRELLFPVLPARIAVISSAKAAGYKDFTDQLHNNPFGYKFYTRLYQSIVQGKESPSSIISSLDRINKDAGLFDLVAVIRGGGSQSDLHSFNNYLLSSNIAQFPLPVITGIGHEKDESVCDMVAHASLKTPTAVAEYLLSSYQELEAFTLKLKLDIFSVVRKNLGEEKLRPERITKQFPPLVINSLHRKTQQLVSYKSKLYPAFKNLNTKASYKLKSASARFSEKLRKMIHDNHHKLSIAEKSIKLLDPENILKRGYSITYHKGNAIKSIKELKKGEAITTKYYNGESESKITEIRDKN